MNFARHYYSVKAKFKSIIPLCHTYAISDTEVIIKRNVPSNALQNKNQHCTVWELKGKGVSSFPVVACIDQGKQVPELRDTEYLAPDRLTDSSDGDKPEGIPAAQSSLPRKTFVKSTVLNIHIAASIPTVLLK